MVTQGFEVPIHQSVIRPQLMMGIPRQLALVLYTIILALTLPLGSWYAIPPGCFCTSCLQRRRRKIRVLDVFRRAFTYRAFYEADTMTLGLTVFLVIAVLIASVGALWGGAGLNSSRSLNTAREPIDSVTCCPGR